MSDDSHMAMADDSHMAMADDSHMAMADDSHMAMAAAVYSIACWLVRVRNAAAPATSASASSWWLAGAL
jgi:hypothetical protein